MNNPMLRLAGVVLGTLGFWFVLAFVVVTALQDFLGYIYWFGGGALLFQVGYGVYASPGGGSKASEAKRVPWLTLLLRGVMAGTAIAIATWIIAVGHPVFAGVASVFPAIFLTIMLVPDIGLRNRMVSQERALHMARGSDVLLLEKAADADSSGEVDKHEHE